MAGKNSVSRMQKPEMGSQRSAARIQNSEGTPPTLLQLLWQAFCMISDVAHSCRYLCSELVTVTFEEQSGEIRVATANLEEISTARVVLSAEEQPELGCSISLLISGHGLFGRVEATTDDGELGWLLVVALDAASLWHPGWFSPQHLLKICECATETALTGVTPLTAKVSPLENLKITEENMPVAFALFEA